MKDHNASWTQLWRHKVRWSCLILFLGCALVLAFGSQKVQASDHDDGETNIKARNLNLTDLFVFREDWHSGNAADQGHLVFVMNTNPRSLPRQPYYFNQHARYNFHVTRVNNVNDAQSGREDLRLEFSFGAPDSNGQQAITFNLHQVVDGVPFATLAGVPAGVSRTTPARPFLEGNDPVTNQFDFNGSTVSVFAGLREDPFYFDVTAFFKVRASLAGRTDGLGPIASPTLTNLGLNPGGFAADAGTAVDFAQGYNVNAIVARVPIALLQSDTGSETVFDVWETITIPKTIADFQ